MSNAGFSDPTVAMRFRDYINSVVPSLLDRLRPLPQYGVILTIARSGATFQTGSSSIPDGPAPEGPGNPSQVYYANVRLDTGEIVPARISENIPVHRQATFYDPLNPNGSTEVYTILDDQYRKNIVVDGASVPDTSIQLDIPPYVPPRVMIEGSAGKYVVTRIIRGMVRFENAVLESPYIVGQQSGFYVNSDLVITSSEYTTNLQGWVGDTAWSIGQAGLEVVLTYGTSYARYEIHPGQITSVDYGKWFLVPPVMETYQRKLAGLTSDVAHNVLLVHFISSSIVHFYVCNRDLFQYTISPDRYLGDGQITVRSKNGTLAPTAGVMPATPTGAGFATFGVGRTARLIREGVDYGAPGTMPTLQADIIHMQRSFTGGGVVTATSIGGAIRLNWTQRFVVMTARTIYKQAGYFDISMPAVGTNIPVVGALTTDTAPLASRAVTADGVDVSGWGGLYYILPFGQDSSSVDANFVWVLYSGYFDIPDNWVLVARRNPESQASAITLANGTDVDTWRIVPLYAGMAHLVGYECMYSKRNGIVYLRGAMVNNLASTIATATKVGELPAGFLPEYPSSIYTAHYNFGTPSSNRFDITSTGNMVIRTAVPAAGQVFVDNISYPAMK
jgi:hypothetical protein